MHSLTTYCLDLIFKAVIKYKKLAVLDYSKIGSREMLSFEEAMLHETESGFFLNPIFIYCIGFQILLVCHHILFPDTYIHCYPLL